MRSFTFLIAAVFCLAISVSGCKNESAQTAPAVESSESATPVVASTTPANSSTPVNTVEQVSPTKAESVQDTTPRQESSDESSEEASQETGDSQMGGSVELEKDTEGDGI